LTNSLIKLRNNIRKYRRDGRETRELPRDREMERRKTKIKGRKYKRAE
jgi:hypothetical protein